MFIPKKDRFLRRDIIDLLEEETDYVTLAEIKERLGYPTFHAVKDACHLLQEEIAMLYDPYHLEMIISVRGGVRLNRYDTNLQKLTENYNQSSIPHHLLLEILDRRTISVEDYCEKNFISKSTLIRHVRITNSLLRTFGSTHKKITVSSEIKIRGSESTLRTLYYFMLAASFDSLADFDGWDEALHLTKMIFAYLDLTSLDIQVQHLAFWTFVCQKAVGHDFRLLPRDPFRADKSFYKFAPKPKFLINWQDDDWFLYLLFFYALTYMPMGEAITLTDDTLFAATIDHWFQTFKVFYFEVDQEQKKRLIPTLQRQLQYCCMTQLSNNISDLIEMPSEKMIADSYPIYHQNFQDFWQLFIEGAPLKKAVTGFKTLAFCDCISLTGLSYFMPTIVIFIITEATVLQNQLIQETIRSYCTNYKVEFTSNYKQADLLVSSVTFIDPIAPHQKLLMIRTSLPKNDLRIIYKEVQIIAKKKSNA